jgi:putative GTP pyrophosphokinase
VRTIFEEGWSEIDHRIRYPNFSDNPLVNYFLTIFNRLSGSADEMGGFVKGLTATLGDLQEQITDANTSKEQSLQAMENALNQIEQLRQQDAESKESIAKLKAEIDQFRNIDNLGSILARRSHTWDLFDQGKDSEVDTISKPRYKINISNLDLDKMRASLSTSEILKQGLLDALKIEKKH